MKNNEFQNSASLREPGHGSLGEARTLFEQMSGEARRQAEIERGATRHRSPLLKLLLALTLVSVFGAAGTFIYGFYSFPDAPLKQNGEVYTGKHGQPRTKADFERFVLWEKVLFTAFGGTFLFGFTFAALDAREKRRRRAIN